MSPLSQTLRCPFNRMAAGSIGVATLAPRGASLTQPILYGIGIRGIVPTGRKPDPTRTRRNRGRSPDLPGELRRSRTPLRTSAPPDWHPDPPGFLGSCEPASRLSTDVANRRHSDPRAILGQDRRRRLAVRPPLEGPSPPAAVASTPSVWSSRRSRPSFRRHLQVRRIGSVSRDGQPSGGCPFSFRNRYNTDGHRGAEPVGSRRGCHQEKM